MLPLNASVGAATEVAATSPGVAAAPLAVPPGMPQSLIDFKLAGKRNAIAKVNYTHDAMIDLIIANPGISQGEIAVHFGYTEGWISQVIASDAFQARLAARKDELVDPLIKASIEERFKGLVHRSIEVLMKKLDSNADKISDELALGAVKVASQALGYGARNGAAVQNNVNFVVQVPAKAASAAEWVKEYAPVATVPANGPAGGTTEIVVGGPRAAVVVAPAVQLTKPDAEALLQELLR